MNNTELKIKTEIWLYVFLLDLCLYVERNSECLTFTYPITHEFMTTFMELEADTSFFLNYFLCWQVGTRIMCSSNLMQNFTFCENILYALLITHKSLIVYDLIFILR